jgi:hypothetical protein
MRIKVVRYDTLRECFLKCVNLEGISEEDAKNRFWVGHNGKRGFRIRIDRWLSSGVKQWGWIDYRSRTLHLYIALDADIFDVIAMISHEVGHFKLPRYPFGHDEEKKAETYRNVTQTAINIAKETMKK